LCYNYASWVKKMTKTKMIEINSNQPEKKSEPKRKMVTWLKVFLAVVVIGGIVAAVFVPGDFFQGFLRKKAYEPVVKFDKSETDKKIEKIVKEEPKEEEVLIDVPITRAEKKEDLEESPLEIVTDVDIELMVPAEIVFAYLDRVDPNSPSIYGNVDVDEEQVVLIFRLENLGTQPAYLQGFDVVSSFNTSGALEGNCHFLASIGGTLVKFNYDSNGDFVNWTSFGADVTTSAGNADGCFEYSEMTNLDALLIPGNSEVVFGVIKDTLPYLWVAESLAGGWYTGTESCNTIDAEAKLGTYTVVNENGVLLNMGVATDSVIPGMMIFK